MKVRLHSDSFELSGYINLTVQEVLVGDTLSSHGFDKGELEEIIADDVVDYLPLTKVESYIVEWSKYLKKGGKLILTGTDLQEVAKAIANYSLDAPQANKLLYGENAKKCCFSVSSMIDFLKEVAHLKIVTKRLNGYTYMVETLRQ